MSASGAFAAALFLVLFLRIGQSQIFHQGFKPISIDSEPSGLELMSFLHNSFNCEENYAQFYDWLLDLTERRISINKIVDEFFDAFRKDLLARNGHIVPLPIVDVALEDGSALPITATFRNWNISGGETIFRSGEATLLLDPSGETRNILINIPFGVWNGSVESGELDLKVWGLNETATFTGDISGSRFHLEITIFSYLRLPTISQFKFLTRGLVEIVVFGWNHIFAWIFTLLILVAVAILFLIALIITTCYLCLERRKTRRLLAEYELNANANTN
jgi:hypothetical protein